MKISFINNILNSHPIVIKFALKLFVCKCLSFQINLFPGLRFPLNIGNVIHILQTRFSLIFRPEATHRQ